MSQYVRETISSSDRPTRARRRVALIGGWSYVALAVLAAVATLGVVQPIAGVHDLMGDSSVVGRLRLATVGLLVVASLDLVVAWAFYEFFAVVDRGLAALAAGFRAVYVAVYVVAIAQLASAANVAAGRPDIAFDRVVDFRTWWEMGLGLFGVHLLLVGALALRSSDVPRLVGILIAVSGAGYAVDCLRQIIVPDGFDVTPVTFVGEVVFIVWLLVKGARHDLRAT